MFSEKLLNLHIIFICKSFMVLALVAAFALMSASNTNTSV